MGKLIRLTTKDRIELHGLLYEPSKKARGVLIHVHGFTGNFYENKFIDDIAKEAVSQGFAFFTFNNRGAGMVNEFMKKGRSKIRHITIGGSIEEFRDCVFDIKAAIDFVAKKGYKTIILQGHSLGCQKIVYYKHKTKDKRVKGLVLLAPVDDVAFLKRFFGSKYKRALEIARKVKKEGRRNDPVPKWMAISRVMNVKVFLNMADAKSLSGKLFDYSGHLKEIKSIDCPKIAIFGSKDEYESSPDKKLEILKETVKACDVVLIKNAIHEFVGLERELAKAISKWIKNITFK